MTITREMARFASYNTSDPNTGNQVLAANASIPVMTLQANSSGQLVGTVISDQPGNLNIDQSFDGTNWDVTNQVAVTGGTGSEISETLFAPFVQVRFTNTGASTQSYLRIFLRAVGQRI